MSSPKKDVQNTAPARSTYIFDPALYSTTARRGRDESMANCATGRRKEFGELKEVSDAITVGRDIQTALILRRPVISMKEQSAVPASNGDNWAMPGIENALRAPHLAIDLLRDRRLD